LSFWLRNNGTKETTLCYRIVTWNFWLYQFLVDR